MADTTKIQWCHHTFNPWRGCSKVSPGCANCYAETLSHRNPAVLGEWGPRGKRVIAFESYWRQTLKWDRAAAKAGERRRVFCASLADVFEARPELDTPRARLLETIEATPHLDWLLLTKRPENWRPLMAVLALGWTGAGTRLAGRWVRGTPLPNVWLGVSVEDQQRASERIPLLCQVPAAVHFVSAEPLLGPLDLSPWLVFDGEYGKAEWCLAHYGASQPISWVIAGGESGPRARPCNVSWIRSIRDQCEDAGVPCFVKQLGRRPEPEGWWDESSVPHVRRLVRDPKGGDPSEWPEDLRVRQFPVTEDTCT